MQNKIQNHSYNKLKKKGARKMAVDAREDEKEKSTRRREKEKKNLHSLNIPKLGLI